MNVDIIVQSLPIIASIPITIIISICSIVAVGYLIYKLPIVLKQINETTAKQNAILEKMNGNISVQNKSLDNNTEALKTFVTSQQIFAERLLTIQKNTEFIKTHSATKDDLVLFLQAHDKL